MKIHSIPNETDKIKQLKKLLPAIIMPKQLGKSYAPNHAVLPQVPIKSVPTNPMIQMDHPLQFLPHEIGWSALNLPTPLV